MPSEGSSSTGKWVIGCLAVGFVGVVLCAGGAFFAVRTALFTARDAARQAMQQAQEAQREILAQQEESQFGMGWAPPAADAAPELLFPEQVGAWQRSSHDDVAEFAELGLSRSGRHAVYESGIVGIDVFVYEVPAEEQNAVFQAAEDAINAGGYSSTSHSAMDDGIVHRMTFSFSPPERHGLMWWCKGWLFVFIADDDQADLNGFQRDYATLIQATGRAMEPKPADPGAGDEARPGGEAAPEGTKDQPESGEGPSPAAVEPASASAPE